MVPKSQRIPKTIHYCWLSDDPLPPLQRKCLKSWKRFLPGYEIVRWNTERFDVESVPFVREAVSVGKWAFAADYIRLHALHAEGGIYLDGDVEILGSLDPFLHHRAFSSIEHWPEIKALGIEGAILGAEAGHPWIAECLDYYRRRSFLDEDGNQDHTIVSEILARIAGDELGFVFEAREQELSQGLHLYPPVVFTHRGGEFSAGETIAIHHCLGGWRARSVLKKLWYQIKGLLWSPRG